MNQTVLHATPRWPDVLVAQLHALGIGLRMPARITLAVTVAVSLLVGVEIVTGDELFHFHPEHSTLPGLIGLVLPAAVWRHEDRFGPAFLWTLPVDRARHALLKVLAGWIWLIGAVALFVLWLLAVTLASGVTPFTEETRSVLPSFSYGVTFEPSAIQHVRWVPEPLLWLVPFTSATGTYLLASALALGSRYPLRWTAGSIPAVFLVLFVVSDLRNLGPNGVDRMLNALVNGPYGLDALLTARTESIQVAAALTTGDRVVVWSGLPNLGEWAIATLLWSGAGLVALAAAAARHREGRRN